MKRTSSVLVLAVLFGAFGIGLAWLLRLRLEGGDIYPPYSSLRADPLGTMALYEAVDRLPGFEARRDHSSTRPLPPGGDTTYLHLGAARREWLPLPLDLSRAVETFLVEGGRLVIMLGPETETPSSRRRDPKTPDPSPTDSPPRDADPDTDSREQPRPDPTPEQPSTTTTSADFAKAWGLGFGFTALERDGQDNLIPGTVGLAVDLELPVSLSWHSGVVLRDLAPEWRVIYARDAEPVVVERRHGEGSVVVATDTYLVSNEALRSERHPGLLSWLIGSNRRVVFDEAHLGVIERRGIAALVRGYRLQGPVAVLLILAGLFVWMNTATLLLPDPGPTGSTAVQGKDAGAGFVSLLRRNVTPREVLRLCVEEWIRSLPRGAGLEAERLEVERILAAEDGRPWRQRDPVAAYRRIAQVLERKSNPPRR